MYSEDKTQLAEKNWQNSEFKKDFLNVNNSTVWCWSWCSGTANGRMSLLFVLCLLPGDLWLCALCKDQNHISFPLCYYFGFFYTTCAHELDGVRTWHFTLHILFQSSPFIKVEHVVWKHSIKIRWYVLRVSRTVNF